MVGLERRRRLDMIAASRSRLCAFALRIPESLQRSEQRSEINCAGLSCKMVLQLSRARVNLGCQGGLEPYRPLAHLFSRRERRSGLRAKPGFEGHAHSSAAVATAPPATTDQRRVPLSECSRQAEGTALQATRERSERQQADLYKPVKRLKA